MMFDMKKLMLCLAVSVVFTACRNEFYEDTVSVKKPLTFDQEFAVVNAYTSIDTVIPAYSVTITNDIMQEKGLTEKNVELIMQAISRINRQIEEDVKSGKVVTLTLNNGGGFKSYTVNADKANVKFEDVYVPASGEQASRGGYVGGMSFSNGNWYDSSDTFEASDHVTSLFSVGACRGYWSVTVVCNTGTSSYGDVFTAYGSSPTSGSIKRYWWYTGGGEAPFLWTFKANGPVGGEASGSFSITDTY